MYRMFVIVLAGLCLFALLRGGVAPAQQQGLRARWEYRVLPAEEVETLGGQGRDLTRGLNALGEQGWELAAADGLAVLERLKTETDPNVVARIREHGTAVLVFKRGK